jgi:hypothetical protein
MVFGINLGRDQAGVVLMKFTFQDPMGSAGLDTECGIVKLWFNWR